MNEAVLQHFCGRDGVELAYREIGDGPPVLLLHGFFTTGTVAWLASGHAARIADRGYRVVMPDMRGHGDSSRPHDPAAYPPDVLTDDAYALVEHLGLVDGQFDLGGYSLGARTIIRMLARGATPRKAAIGGAGFKRVITTEGTGETWRHILGHLGQHEWGSREWVMEGFLRKVKGDPVAMLLVLDTPVDTSPDELAAIAAPILVMSGSEDDPDGGRELAGLLRDASFLEIPGDHVSASSTPELGEAMARFFN